MESEKKKNIFDEKGKLKPVKKTAEELLKENPPSKKLETEIAKAEEKKKPNPKKEITAEQFIEQINTQLETTSRWDGYEHIIKTNGKQGRICAWIADRKNHVAMSIFPPFNENWKTIRINTQAEANNAIIMLKAKINGFSKA